MELDQLLTSADVARALDADVRRVRNILTTHRERIPRAGVAGITLLYPPDTVGAVQLVMDAQRPLATRVP